MRHRGGVRALPVIVALGGGWPALVGCELPLPQEPRSPAVSAATIADVAAGEVAAEHDGDRAACRADERACEHVTVDVSRGGSADVLARWLRGDSVDEIAQSLGVAPDDVRWRLIGSVRWAGRRISYDRVYAAP